MSFYLIYFTKIIFIYRECDLFQATNFLVNSWIPSRSKSLFYFIFSLLIHAGFSIVTFSSFYSFPLSNIFPFVENFSYTHAHAHPKFIFNIFVGIKLKNKYMKFPYPFSVSVFQYYQKGRLAFLFCWSLKLLFFQKNNNCFPILESLVDIIGSST